MSPVTGSPALLEIRDVEVHFGGVVALDGVSFDVGRQQICGIIGPNGSGKTTLFNCISGIYRSARGDIIFEGRSLLSVRRHQIAGLGIGRTFQNVALFNSLNVKQNILAGAYHLAQSGLIANTFRLPIVRREEAAQQVQLIELLSVLGLNAVGEVLVSQLPFGMKKRVELARALISRPKLLLLDEPAGGLNHAEIDALEALLRDIRDRFSLSILLVEHHMNLVMRVSDKVVALEFGRKLADGRPEHVREDPEVIRAYLGVDEHARVA